MFLTFLWLKNWKLSLVAAQVHDAFKVKKILVLEYHTSIWIRPCTRASSVINHSIDAVYTIPFLKKIHHSITNSFFFFFQNISYNKTPRSLYFFSETETDKRFSFKLLSNIWLVLLSKSNRRFFGAVHLWLIVEEFF